MKTAQKSSQKLIILSSHTDCQMIQSKECVTFCWIHPWKFLSDPGIPGPKLRVNTLGPWAMFFVTTYESFCFIHQWNFWVLPTDLVSIHSTLQFSFAAAGLTCLALGQDCAPNMRWAGWGVQQLHLRWMPSNRCCCKIGALLLTGGRVQHQQGWTPWARFSWTEICSPGNRQRCGWGKQRL